MWNCIYIKSGKEGSLENLQHIKEVIMHCEHAFKLCILFSGDLDLLPY